MQQFARNTGQVSVPELHVSKGCRPV